MGQGGAPAGFILLARLDEGGAAITPRPLCFILGNHYAWQPMTVENDRATIIQARQTMAAAGGGRKRKRRREVYVELFWIR